MCKLLRLAEGCCDDCRKKNGAAQKRDAYLHSLPNLAINAEIGGFGVAKFSWRVETTDFQLVWQDGASWLFGCRVLRDQWVYRTVDLPPAKNGKLALRVARDWVNKGAEMALDAVPS